MSGTFARTSRTRDRKALASDLLRDADRRDITTQFMFFALLRKAVTGELDGWPEILVVFDGKNGSASRQASDAVYKANRDSSDAALWVPETGFGSGAAPTGHAWREQTGRFRTPYICSPGCQCSSLSGTARRRSGSSGSISRSATSASNCASCAPMQKWTPRPNPR